MILSEANALNLLVALVVIFIVAFLMATKTVTARLDTIADAVKRGDMEVEASTGL